MSYAQHVLYSRESVFGTWVTPALAVATELFGVRSQREQVQLRATGAGRGVFQTELGAKAVNGPWRFVWWPLNLLEAFGAAFRDNASTLVTAGVYDHGLTINDDAGLLPLSIQGQYSATRCLNILSAVPNTLTLTAASKAVAVWSWDLLAKDEARNGSTWDNDGTSAPAIIAVSPTDYDVTRPLMFYDAALTLGGTPSFNGTTKLWSISGGTDYCNFHLAEIQFQLGLDADAFGLCEDPTVQELWPGPRSIALTLESSWTDLNTTFYDAFKAGTEMAFRLKLAGPTISGGYKYEGEVVLPVVHFDPDAIFPDIGPQDRPKSRIRGNANRDSTTGRDHGLRIRSSESSI